MSIKPKKLRGFAAMSLEERTEISKKGGASVPASKRSFSLNRDLAKIAGSKGGKAVSPEKRTFSTNTDLAKWAGRKGGLFRNS